MPDDYSVSGVSVAIIYSFCPGHLGLLSPAAKMILLHRALAIWTPEAQRVPFNTHKEPMIRKAT